ncbi:MAG TPA: hypothetical protein DD473_15375 [Planctomycetaceae bacterium]|nr:hypothetical protein [Planctomycetaceae bacterium]
MKNVFDRIASRNGHSHEQSVIVSQSNSDQPAEVTEYTSKDVKEITQELLKHGHVDESTKPDLFQRVIFRNREILSALEPLDLAVRLDTNRGVAFLVVAESAYDSSDEGQAWAHPLVRRQRLTLEQSLLVAILRQAFVMHEQESGIGHSAAKIAVDDLIPHFLTYFDDSGSDSRNESRLMSLLDQLKVHGIVSEIDTKQEVTIRPMIAHLANPESLTALLRILQEQVREPESTQKDSE